MSDRRFIVHVEGYAPEEFIAPTASKARYRAFVAFTEAGPRISFHDFLQRIHVRLGSHRHKAPPKSRG